MYKTTIKMQLRLSKSLAQYRLPTGFSMLEAVVVVGVLLALAVGGFFAYGPITENAKMAKVKSAASEVLTAATVASFDGYSETQPQDVIDKWNSSTDQIRVEILELESGSTTSNGDFCVQATNIADPQITSRTGSCSGVLEGSTPDTDGDGIPNESDPDADNDGIPNDSDPDIDGDGVPNGKDTTPNGENSPVGGDVRPAVMVSTWDTSIVPLWNSYDCMNITLPLTGAVDVTVDWGDGKPAEPFTSGALPTHQYTDTPGIKTVRIEGTFTGWVGENWTGWTEECITEVTEWGDTGTTDVVAGFYDASSLTHVSEIPAAATDWQYLFTYTRINNPEISSWDTSRVTNMEGVFNLAEEFNQPLNDWDTSNVTNMSAMFAHAYKFNQPIHNWDTSNVVNMGNMFLQAKTFNHPLEQWNTSSVTDMSGMFLLADMFNQPLNDWDTSKVTDMSSMFYRIALFNQPLSGWDTSNVKDISRMFNLSKVFNQDISGWDFGSVTKTIYFSDESALAPENLPVYEPLPCTSGFC